MPSFFICSINFTKRKYYEDNGVPKEQPFFRDFLFAKRQAAVQMLQREFNMEFVIQGLLLPAKVKKKVIT